MCPPSKEKEEEEIQKNGCMLPICPSLHEKQVSWKLYQEIFFYVSFIRSGHMVIVNQVLFKLDRLSPLWSKQKNRVFS